MKGFLLGLISLGLLGGLVLSLSSMRNLETIEFKTTLNKKQLIIYQKINNFRMNIFIQGLFLGLLVSLFILTFYQNKNQWINAGIFTSTILFVNYMYYSLFPKPMWMLDYITNTNQAREWLDIYKFMKNRYHLGILFGLLFFYFLYMTFMIN